uniref:Uncharacterized protein n=1 Tax=Hyaloperonospora arabidopsidis (strain Emoy2) TaxID=559515 RepID=M4B2Q8_HYAAE
MRRTPHRSLKATWTCSEEVTACYAEGSDPCEVGKQECPPCMYALSGGEFSCYSRNKTEDCPFADAHECDKPKSKHKSTKSSSSDGASRSSGQHTTGKTPEKEEEPDGGPASSNPSFGHTISPDNTLPPPSIPMPYTHSDATQPSSQAAQSNEAGQALTHDNTTTKGSPTTVQYVLISGAILLVLLLIVFLARHLNEKKKKKKMMKRNQDPTVMSRNSQWSDRTFDTEGTGGHMYSAYSYETDPSQEITMLADSQASSTYDASASFSRSTADFSNFGGKSQFAESSPYYCDYGVSTGPDVVANNGPRHYGNNGLPPVPLQASGNFVDVTASSANCRPYEMGVMRAEYHPLTVSQLMPTAGGGVEAKDKATASRPKLTSYDFAKPPPGSRQIPFFGVSGVSTASSMRSDYDIVDPITMRDVEARNTEMLAQDNRYPKFSFESEVGIYDRSSSEGDDSNEGERVHHGEEHMI